MVRPCANHAEALKQAEGAAHQYAPKHPTMPSRRQIFQIDNGSWLVRVRGATQTVSYRVSVGRYVGTFDADGNPA